MRGYKVMYDYRGKVFGIISSAICVILLMLEKLTHFIIFPKMNAEQHYTIFLWLTIFSLFCIGYSTEKNEDERSRAIRYKAIMIAFMIETGTILAYGLTVSISAYHPGAQIVSNAADQVDFGRMLMFMPAMAIVIYLLYFHIGLYWDELWDYSDNIGFIENLRKNYVHIIVITISVLFLTVLVASVFM